MCSSARDGEANMDHRSDAPKSAESDVELDAAVPNSDHQVAKEAAERLDRFSHPSVGLYHGKRGCSCEDNRAQSASAAVVGASGKHQEMIHLVENLYEGKSSSFLPEDIRRDRAEAEAATGFDKAAGYGEVALDHFVDMLDLLGARAGQNFYDLGSGLGALVFAAGLLGMDATGIEIVHQRHLQACAAVQQAEKQGVGHDHGSINFVHGSFYDYDFSDADIVFINSVLFVDDMMRVIADKGRSMKHGARIITFLALPDAGKGQHQPEEGCANTGTWFRRMKNINLKTTFSSGTPWKSYTVMRSDNMSTDSKPLPISEAAVAVAAGG